MEQEAAVMVTLKLAAATAGMSVAYLKHFVEFLGDGVPSRDVMVESIVQFHKDGHIALGGFWRRALIRIAKIKQVTEWNAAQVRESYAAELKLFDCVSAIDTIARSEARLICQLGGSLRAGIVAELVHHAHPSFFLDVRDVMATPFSGFETGILLLTDPPVHKLCKASKCRMVDRFRAAVLNDPETRDKFPAADRRQWIVHNLCEYHYAHGPKPTRWHPRSLRSQEALNRYLEAKKKYDAKGAGKRSRSAFPQTAAAGRRRGLQTQQGCMQQRCVQQMQRCQMRPRARHQQLPKLRGLPM